MKRFFPSSVMLTPFVVKYYSEQDDEELDATNEQEQDNELDE